MCRLSMFRSSSFVYEVDHSGGDDEKEKDKDEDEVDERTKRKEKTLDNFTITHE